MKTNELPFNKLLEIVTSFYDAAIADPMIGFHFRHIEDFSEHLPKIASFWQLQLFGYTEKKYQFNLLGAHDALPLLPGQIDRWVVIFKENLNQYEVDKELTELWLNKVDSFADKIKAHLKK